MKNPDHHNPKKKQNPPGPSRQETRTRPLAQLENDDWEFWRDKSLSVEKNYKARCENLLAQLEAKSLQCRQAEHMLCQLEATPWWKLAFEGKRAIRMFFIRGNPDFEPRREDWA